MPTEEQDRGTIAQIWDTSADLQDIYQRRGLQWLLQALVSIHNGKRIWAMMQILEQAVSSNILDANVLESVLNNRLGQVDRQQVLDYVTEVVAADPSKAFAASLLLLMNELTAYGKTNVVVAGSASSQPQA